MRIDLFATSTGELLASVDAAPATVNVDRRLIGGIGVPFGVVGSPNIGRALFDGPSSITVPAMASRVKLLVQHDDNQSVGFLQAHEVFPSALVTAFKVADGPAGDAALANAANMTRDGLSVRVEVDSYDQRSDGVLVVKASRLREVSLVSIPAFDDARVTTVAAATNTEREHIMTRLSEMLELRASAPAPAADPAPAPAPAVVTPPAAPVLDGTFAAALAAAIAPALAAAGIGQPSLPSPTSGPTGTPPVHTTRQAPATLMAAAQVVSEWAASGSGNVAELYAALSDVVPANDAGLGFVGRGQWLGELWTASRTDRPFIEAFGAPQDLTSMTIKGWKWITKPAVADYAGNKAAIPSNAVATGPATGTAKRVAGGWDVDRIYVDLGESDMVAALFKAAVEDYRAKSNAYFGAGLMTSATNLAPATTSLAASLAAMGAAAGAIGARIGFVAVAPDVFGDLTELTRDEVPWWFGSGDGIALGTSSGNVGGMKFWADAALPPGVVLGGDTNAATFYEKKTPIQVQAVNIPNGGVDLGVFGYCGFIVNDARALFTTGDTTP